MYGKIIETACLEYIVFLSYKKQSMLLSIDPIISEVKPSPLDDDTE